MLLESSPRRSAAPKIIELTPPFRRAYIRYLIICHVIPALGMLVAFSLLFYRPIGLPEVSMFFAMWLPVTLSITVGYHRLFTHRSFSTTRLIRVSLAILAAMAGQGSAIYWVSVHRRHHECSDVDGDPHSPHENDHGFWNKIRGLLHSHMGWTLGHEYPNPLHYAPDLVSDRDLNWISRHLLAWFVIGLLIPAVAVGCVRGTWYGALSGLLWGGFVRVFVGNNIVWSVNSICHSFGSRPFSTREHSTNNVLLAIPTLGEAWHNNHHAFQTSAIFGLRWWEIDIGGAAVRVLQVLGLAWEVKIPSPEMVEQKRGGVVKQESESTAPADSKSANH